MPNITIKLDIEKDAWNWWGACNKISYGMDWKMRIEPELREKITGKTQDEAFSFLIPYINNIYLENDSKSKAETLQREFKEREEELFATMERLTKHKIYREDFTCFLTTFPRCPYEYKNGLVWIPYKREIDRQVIIFAHELLHFQFFTYYAEEVKKVLIDPKKFDALKEGMTIILDEEFAHITSEKDKGYDIHEEERKEFLKLWKKLKDFDLFVDEATKFLLQKKL